MKGGGSRRKGRGVYEGKGSVVSVKGLCKRGGGSVKGGSL